MLFGSKIYECPNPNWKLDMSHWRTPNQWNWSVVFVNPPLTVVPVQRLRHQTRTRRDWVSGQALGHGKHTTSTSQTLRDLVLTLQRWRFWNGLKSWSVFLGISQGGALAARTPVLEGPWPILQGRLDYLIPLFYPIPVGYPKTGPIYGS